MIWHDLSVTVDIMSLQFGHDVLQHDLKAKISPWVADARLGQVLCGCPTTVTLLRHCYGVTVFYGYVVTVLKDVWAFKEKPSCLFRDPQPFERSTHPRTSQKARARARTHACRLARMSFFGLLQPLEFLYT